MYKLLKFIDMRKIFLGIALLILLQSCYSYKQVEANPTTMVIGQKYKIEQNNKTSKVIYIKAVDSAVVVSKNGKEEQIALKDITKVRERKFSLIKTIALVPLTAGAIVLLFVISDPIQVDMSKTKKPN
jgi:hypothetical protein